MKTISTCIALFMVLWANAQWTTDTAVNTLVADSEAGDMQALGTSDGKTYVVFWKSVPAPTNYELRLQILDANGNQTLGNDGMLVSNTIPMGTYTSVWNIAVDANDNLYIGVTGTGGGDPAYVFKLDSAGNHLWGNGVNVGSGFAVTLLPLSTGEALVGWLGSSGAVMQKFDSSGTPVWPSAQPIEVSGEVTAPANFFEISGNEYVAVFHVLTGGINSNLYAQRYDVDGNPVWASPVQLSDNATAFNRSYTGLQDGDVVYMGYFASSGTRFDSYLQRINPDGTLPWGINGSDFNTNQTDYEMSTETAFEPGSQYIWAVCSYTNSSQSEYGEYVQKFDKNTGARLLSDTGREVYSIGSDTTHVGSLWLKNGSPLFLAVEGVKDGVSPLTLHAVYLDSNGDFAWPQQSIPVATFSASKGRIQYTKPVNNQSVAVFVEDKGIGPRIYAQNVLDDILSTNSFSKNKLFYANPVKAQMILRSDAPIKAVSVYNTLGQRVFNATFKNAAQIAIDTQNWSNGLYLMNVHTNKGMNSGIKLVKH